MRILILGGGFGGFAVARRLAKRLPPGASVLVIDRNDFHTFWPMVPEVIPGSIEFGHVLLPLDRELPRRGANFLRATIHNVDLDAKAVETSSGTFTYDKLVIAIGWQTDFHSVEGAGEVCLRLESAIDALRIRDSALDRLQEAAAAANSGQAVDPATLGFAVVGGGSTGVEVAANLRELLDDLSGRYPGLPASDIKVHLLQAQGEVLPHLEPALQRITETRLRAERIEVRTGAEVHRVDAAGVLLADGSRVEARTVIWAAGVRPAALAGSIRGLSAHDNGNLRVDAFLRIAGRAGVYGLGDCAAVKSDGGRVAPTAQAAVQEGRVVADNLVAELRGIEPMSFRYRSRGRLVDLGSRFAVAEVMGRELSGELAQALWRAVYLYKLGGALDRARVLGDWVLDALHARHVTRQPS